MLTEHLPRVSLGFFPTPLEEMPRLTQFLGGPRLWIKRDDQTGLATGGNKTRKLEFSVAEALAQQADTLVTVGAVQSNHCRQTAAAATRHGLKCVLVIRGQAPESVTGNLLLDHLLGARIVFSGDRSREAVAEEVLAELKSSGAAPYFIPVGASNAIGAAGFVAGMEELYHQMEQGNLQADRIVFASSSAGTQAGLCVGAKLLGFRGQITAIAIDSTREQLSQEVAHIAAGLIQRLRVKMAFSPEEVIAYDSYLGAGYSIMGAPEQEAIELVARHEGILLDPVYTGRAMAGLIDLIRQGQFSRDENVIFWHTGGSAALYAYANQLMGQSAPDCPSGKMSK
ncbi:MAG TPA: D-cysteine desulfhydrase family protein [Anaerolineaceae bacterium]|jgi:D-cysteine desulfhydrase family pyridoxal phosphate-dependent enzyme|nr:D-cysteine desulfhydrase family protein [Anaerolineaceae bacterium]